MQFDRAQHKTCVSGKLCMRHVTAADLACIQDGAVACASAQVAIQAFLQDVLCWLFSLVLARGQRLVSGHNKARSAETAL